MDDPAAREEEVEAHVRAGNTDAAVKLLCELIIAHAKAKNFIKAEALRDQLMEVDGMALSEIVSTGEVIDQEKQASLDTRHLAIWTSLYSLLTPDETNALFYAMTKTVYQKDQVVSTAGDMRPALYVVDRGELTISFDKDGATHVIGTVKGPVIVGYDTFFEMSACTVTLKAVTESELYILDQTVLERWQTAFPAIGSKLTDYCLKQPKVADMMAESGLDRRLTERGRVAIKADIQPLTPAGQPTANSYRCTLDDISDGGVSFDIKLVKRVQALELLGGQITIGFDIPGKEKVQRMVKTGEVRAIGYDFYSDYTIHLKFTKPLKTQNTDVIKRIFKRADPD